MNTLSLYNSLSSAHSVALNPCTPYCPGVNGFPELECTGCQSLFHSKCVGISQALIPRLLTTWKCRVSIVYLLKRDFHRMDVLSLPNKKWIKIP